MKRILETIISIYDNSLDFNIIEESGVVSLGDASGRRGSIEYTISDVDRLTRTVMPFPDDSYIKYIENILKKMKSYQRDINIKKIIDGE